VGELDMLSGKQITAPNLTDWRKLGQGLHARFVVDDFCAGARFAVVDALRCHVRICPGEGYGIQDRC
jgi:4a-hydroxytetrahydrobiopterin dehydratase